MLRVEAQARWSARVLAPHRLGRGASAVPSGGITFEEHTHASWTLFRVMQTSLHDAQYRILSRDVPQARSAKDPSGCDARGPRQHGRQRISPTAGDGATARPR